MGQVIDLTGQKFGRLLVIERVYPSDGENYSKEKCRATWKCRCDCGKETIVTGKHLRSGNTKSCGCIHKEILEKRNYETAKHHGRDDRLYQFWQSMIRRCEKENHPAYKYYGGRGITVCSEWHTYSVFREWAISNGYERSAQQWDCTLDRRNTNDSYNPDNCRWVTMKVQANNRRNNRIVEGFGEKHTISEWANMFGVPYYKIHRNLEKGKNIEQIKLLFM